MKSFRLTIADIPVTLILAFMFTVAPSYIGTGKCTYSPLTACHMAIYFVVFLMLAIAARWLLSRPGRDPRPDLTAAQSTQASQNDPRADLTATQSTQASQSGPQRRPAAQSVARPGLNSLLTHKQSAARPGLNSLLTHKHSVLLLALLMFLLWLPTLIILYPGTAINDTWGQLRQFHNAFYAGDAIRFRSFKDHHPVATTLIMGAMILPLGRATGNLQIAFFVYVLLQSFLTCLTFSYSLVYMRRKLQLDTGLVLAAFILYSLFPIFPCSAQTICKDSMSAIIFTLFTIAFMELIRSRGKYLDLISHLLGFLLICWLLCITKKVSFYVVSVSLLVALPVIRRNRKKVGLVLLIIILLMQVAWPMTMDKLGIRPGPRKEMFSLPMQMTARYVKDHPDDITEEEYIVIDKVLQMSDLADRYNPVSADPVKKFAFKGDHSGKDYMAYFRVWLAQGLRHPTAYIDAVLSMESGWFSFSKYYPLLSMEWHSQLKTEIFDEANAERPSAIAPLANGYQQLLDTLYDNILLRPLFSYGLYASLIPAFVICTLLWAMRTHGFRSLVVSVPMFFSIALGCWLAPLSIHFEGRRYLYPVTYTLLLLIAWCRYCLREPAENSSLARET